MNTGSYGTGFEDGDPRWQNDKPEPCERCNDNCEIKIDGKWETCPDCCEHDEHDHGYCLDCGKNIWDDLVGRAEMLEDR